MSLLHSPAINILFSVKKIPPDPFWQVSLRIDCCPAVSCPCTPFLQPAWALPINTGRLWIVFHTTQKFSLTIKIMKTRITNNSHPELGVPSRVLLLLLLQVRCCWWEPALHFWRPRNKQQSWLMDSRWPLSLTQTQMLQELSLFSDNCGAAQIQPLMLITQSYPL